MSAIAKSTVNGGPSLATTIPSHNHMIGPFGDTPSGRGGISSGAGETIGACDLCYIAADGNVMRALEDQTGTTTAVNDVQTMSALGDASKINGGTYVIGYKGVYTAPFLITDSNSTVQTAVRALTSVAGANITVTGAFPALVFTAAGSFAGTELDLIEVNPSLTTSDNTYAGLQMVHTTVGQPVGASGAEQAQSRVRGICNLPTKRGQPVTLYDACIVNYSDGLLTSGADVFLSSTVPGGLDTVATLATQKPVGFCMDTQRIYFFGIR